MFNINILAPLLFIMIYLSPYCLSQENSYSRFQIVLPIGYTQTYKVKVSVKRKDSGGVLGKSFISFVYTSNFKLKADKPLAGYGRKGLVPPVLRSQAQNNKQHQKGGESGGMASEKAEKYVDLLFVDNTVKISDSKLKMDSFKSTQVPSKGIKLRKFPNIRVRINESGEISDPPHKNWMYDVLLNSFHYIIIPAMIIPRANAQRICGNAPLQWSTLYLNATTEKGPGQGVVVLRNTPDEYFRMRYAVVNISEKTFDIVGWDDVKQAFAYDDAMAKIAAEALREAGGKDFIKSYSINMTKRLWARCDLRTGMPKTLVYSFSKDGVINKSERYSNEMLVLLNREDAEIPESAKKQIKALQSEAERSR